MKKENENVELIDDEEIVTLYDDQNNPVDFFEVAVVEYEDKFYALLQPVKPIEGIGEDEAVIFELKEQDDDTDLFIPVADEALLEKVFEEYVRAVSDKECGCGCDCEDGCDEDGCGEGCDCHDSKCDCKK